MSTRERVTRPAGQADICHWDANRASVITVSTKAVSAHVASHGDSLAALYFADGDGDGYGDAGGATDRCPNVGFVGNNTDCDDGDADVNPGAAEVPYDGVDNDCAAGTHDDDLDEDGFGQADDCDDADASVNPGADEVCDNAADDNCDGGIDEGCAGDCPCYTTADLDAGYADYLDGAGGREYQSSSLSCDEYTSSDPAYGYTFGEVYFENNGASADGTFEQEYLQFYGVTSDYYGDYCNAYHQSYRYDGVNYSSDFSQNFQYVTEEEAVACKDLALEWANDNAITCAVYNY